MAEFDDRRLDIDSDADPAAAFLAREQNDLAGLEIELDETKPSEGGVGTILSNGDGSIDYTVNSFEVIDAGILLKADTEAYNVFGGVSPTLLMGGGGGVVLEEQENIRKWREEQVKRLEIKDREEEVKREEWREVAHKELEDWYRNHEETIAKTKAQNRNAEKQFVAEEGEIAPGSEWERIARLCDFNPKVKGGSGAAVGASAGSSSHAARDRDVTRMRTIILQRKQAQQQQQAQITAA